MSVLRAAVTPAALPMTNSVLPPPRSTTRTLRSAAWAARWRRRQRTRPASSAPLTTSGAMPSRAWIPAVKTSLLPASRVALVATKRTRSTPMGGNQRGVVVGCGKGALQRLLGQHACDIHALPQPDHAHFAVHISAAPLHHWLVRRSGTSAMSRRMELVPQSMAATRMERPFGKRWTAGGMPPLLLSGAGIDGAGIGGGIGGGSLAGCLGLELVQVLDVPAQVLVRHGCLVVPGPSQ